MPLTGCGDYLSNMSADMTQMVIAISNWGSNSFDWFQHGVCSGSCSETSTWSSLKNFEFNTSSNHSLSLILLQRPSPLQSLHLNLMMELNMSMAMIAPR